MKSTEVNNAAWEQDVFLLGSGGSLRGFDYDKLKGKFVIAVNHSCVKFPECNALIFGDADFYTCNNGIRTEFLSNYEGMIFAGRKANYNDDRENVYVFGYNNRKPQLRIEDGLFNSGLTGLAALNLAIVMGARRIYLLGFDLNPEVKTKYVKNDMGRNGEEYYGNRRWIDWRIEKFKAFLPWHNKIVNCSEISMLCFFKYKDILEVL